MDQVKRMLDAGVALPTAIKECLSKREPPLTLEALAESHGVSPTTLSSAINGGIRPTDAVIEMLVAEFGGSAYEWRYSLWKASEPMAAAS